MAGKIQVIISGYYGFGNTGDEAILSALLRTIGNFPQVEVTVISSRPRSTSYEHNVRSVSRLNMLSIFCAIARSQLLISGGGGLLQDITSSRSLLYYLSVILLGRILKKKVVLLAQSIGPIRKKLNRTVTRWVLDKTDLITVRDEHSARELEELGVTQVAVALTADLALLLEPVSNERQRQLLENLGLNGQRFVVFCLRTLKGRPFPVELFSSLAERITRTIGLKVLFLPFQASFDLNIAKTLTELSPTSVLVEYQLKPEELIALFQKAELIVGMRLHSLIFAAKARTPFLAISYDPKVTAFANLLAAETIPLEELDEKNFFCKFTQIAENHVKIKSKLEQRMIELETKAEANWEYLKEIIDGLPQLLRRGKGGR